MDDPDETATAPPPPVTLAGSVADGKLRLAGALSREEVLRRRRRRLMQLHSVYRSQLWALAEDLHAKHAEYWWHHGASPVVAEPAMPHLENGRGAASVENCWGVGATAAFPPTNFGYPLLPPANGGGAGASVTPLAAGGGRTACSAANCAANAIPCAPYCFDHILLDPKQQLYKPCAFITKRSSMPNVKETCGKPVLRGITPSRCPDHDPKSQKNIVEALRNAGIDLPLGSKVPKLSLLISEAVRQIQKKRKLFLARSKAASRKLLK